MFPRHLEPRIREALADTPVVYLQGGRQTGKSTLVQALAGPDYDADYLTLDDAAVFASARHDAEGFIAGLERPTILDEVQRVPQLFPAIKKAIDTSREPGRFLLTGSANILVVPELARHLVGRVEILTLWPLSQGELRGGGETFIDNVFRSGSPSWPSGPFDSRPISRILRGGFPEAVARENPKRRRAWFGSYLTTILQRDVRDLANIEGLEELPRLLALLAARASTLCNHSELSRTSRIPQTTLKRYLNLLAGTFLLQLLKPWLPNVAKRLVKSPKINLCDSGLTTHLLGADEKRIRTDSILAGSLLENFVASELRKQASWSPLAPSLYHYRSHGGSEVDLVLERPSGEIVGIETKTSTSISSRDLRGLEELQQVAGKKFVRGIILYGGNQIVPFGSRLLALPLGYLWET